MTSRDRSGALWELRQRLSGAKRARRSAKTEEERHRAGRDVALLEEEIEGLKALMKMEQQVRKDTIRITKKLS